MSKKLQRYIDEIERTERKMEELQRHLEDLRTGQKQEEELEMVRVLRSLKLGSKDLMRVLSGLQDGTMSIKDLDPEEQEAFDDAGEEALPEEALGHGIQKTDDFQTDPKEQEMEGGSDE